MQNKVKDLFQIIKSNTFIVFVPIFIFTMAFLNKLFIYLHYNIPFSFIKISIEDLYSAGLSISFFTFFLFFIYAGIFLTIEMYIIQNLPSKYRKKAYEILIGIYLFYIPITLFGIFEFLTSRHLTSTILFAKGIGVLILFLFIIGMVTFLLKKIGIIKNQSKETQFEQADYIFNNLLDKFKIRSLLYFGLIFILAITLNYAFTNFTIENTSHFYTTFIDNDKYIYIDKSGNNLLMKKASNNKDVENLLILPIEDFIDFNYENLIINSTEEMNLNKIQTQKPPTKIQN